MSTETLQHALACAGITAEVEARGALAVLRIATPAVVRDCERRARMVALATEHGFTHVALELSAGDAAFYRD